MTQIIPTHANGLLSDRTDDSNRMDLIEQLYDDWLGLYLVCRIQDGEWEDVGILTRQEAIYWKNPNRMQYSLYLVIPKRKYQLSFWW